MRSKLLAFLTVLSTLATAQAADFPARRAPVYFPPPIPIFTWTGFFVGGNAGAVFNSGVQTTSSFLPATPPGSGVQPSPAIQAPTAGRNNVGFTGGGQIGYNYQIGGPGAGLPGLGGLGLDSTGGIVLGVVADAQYLDRRPSYSNVNDFFGTVRGRVGVAFGRTLVFGSGGFAYDTRTTGYAFGGGLEYGFTDNLSIGAEYLRVNNLNSRFSVPASVFGSNVSYLIPSRDFNVARAFLNYRFSYAVAPPVVARY